MVYRKYKLSLELNNKITVITGNSATGKSTIHKILDVKDGSKQIKISDTRYDIHNIADTHQLEMETISGGFNPYNIYVIDEGRIDIDNDLADKIQHSTFTYFVIIARTALGKLNFPLSAVSTLVTGEDGVIRLKPINSDNINFMDHINGSE